MLLSACASSGTKVDQTTFTAFRKGVSTCSEIKERLGSPSQSLVKDNGDLVLAYSYSAAQAHPENFIPVVRAVCLAHDQYDCWWPQDGNADRERILNIPPNNPAYPPYLAALGVAASALAGDLADVTSGAVSYYDSDECACPDALAGKNPCHVRGPRIFFNLGAVS